MKNPVQVLAFICWPNISRICFYLMFISLWTLTDFMLTVNFRFCPSRMTYCWMTQIPVTPSIFQNHHIFLEKKIKESYLKSMTIILCIDKLLNTQRVVTVNEDWLWCNVQQISMNIFSRLGVDVIKKNNRSWKHS